MDQARQLGIALYKSVIVVTGTGMAFYISAFLSVCIILGAVIRGGRKGFVEEFRSAVSVAAALICLRLFWGLYKNWKMQEFSGLIMGVVMILIFAGLYKLFRILLEAVHTLAELPVIRIADRLLGAALGAAEGILIVIVLYYIWRHYIYTGAW